MLLKERDRAVSDPAVDVQFDRQGAPPAAPRSRIGHAGVFALQERLGRRISPSQPGEVVAVDTVPMSAGIVDRLKAVVRQRKSVDSAFHPHRLRLGEISGVELVCRVTRWQVGRFKVELSDSVGAVAGVRKNVRDGRHARPRTATVLENAVTPRVQAGHKAVAGGHADGVGCVGALKENAVTGQRIDMGRVQIGMSHASELTGLLLVGVQDKEVRSIRHRGVPFWTGGSLLDTWGGTACQRPEGPFHA